MDLALPGFVLIGLLVLGLILAMVYRKPKPEPYPLQFIVQYRVEGMGTPEDLDRGHRAADEISRALYSAESGDGDGTDIGGGTMNLFFKVADPRRALDIALSVLGNRCDRSIIAYRTLKGELVVLWPRDYQGPFKY